MKTTVEISDGLSRQAKREFELRDGSFGGEGLSPEFRGERWDDIRDAIDEGRGS